MICLMPINNPDGQEDYVAVSLPWSKCTEAVCGEEAKSRGMTFSGDGNTPASLEDFLNCWEELNENRMAENQKIEAALNKGKGPEIPARRIKMQASKKKSELLQLHPIHHQLLRLSLRQVKGVARSARVKQSRRVRRLSSPWTTHWLGPTSCPQRPRTTRWRPSTRHSMLGCPVCFLTRSIAFLVSSILTGCTSLPTRSSTAGLQRSACRRLVLHSLFVC